MKPNEWLTDQKFLQNVEFYDKYYFNSLCLYIDNFIKNVPIPCITSWDYKYEQIYFTVGQESKPFKVDVNIAYRDYITLVLILKECISNYHNLLIIFLSGFL